MKTRTILESITDGFMALDAQFRITYFNETGARMVGMQSKELIGGYLWDLFPHATSSKFYTEYHRAIETNTPVHFEEFYPEPLNAWIEVHGYPSPEGLSVYFRDITERKQAEANQALLTDILSILNQARELRSTIAKVLRLLRERTGFDAVGLRLRQGEDFPYFEQDGFTEEFLRQENSLCRRTAAGVARNTTGKALLECTCGIVLSGRTVPEMSCFTKTGSFWTNASSELLKLSQEEDPRTNPRNRCIHAGFASVGLFPVRAGQEIIGLLQLNSRQPGRFAKDSINFFENLAQNIGLALQRANAEEALRESESRVRRKLQSVLAPEGDLGELELADLIDVPALQALMNDFHAVVAIPMAIIDIKGKVLVGVGWQDICTHFHRMQPEAFAHCLESDIHLSGGLKKGEFRLYKCKNHMWDMATPLFVDERHVGNIFTGQFFFEDEPIDYDLFRSQAKRFGFQEEEYFAALARVPRLKKGLVDKAISFFIKLAEAISHLAYSNANLARTLAEKERLADSLRESRKHLEKSQQIAHLGSWELDLVKKQLVWSDEVYRIFGLQPQEFGATYEAFLEHVHPDDRAAVDAAYAGSLRQNLDGYEIEHRVIRKTTGEIRFVHEKSEHLRDAGGRIIRSAGMVHDITERKLIEKTLLFLAQSTPPLSGESFFESLARHLGETLGTDYVCIDRLEGENLFARTLAVFFDGRFEENVAYALKDTPCGEVLKKRICLFPKDVRRLFPKDLVLQEMEAESYVGTTLWDAKGEPIGLIAVISRRPMTNPQFAESILRLVSIRAAGELERKQHEEALKEARRSLERERNLLQSMIDTAANSHLVYLDRDFNFVRVNETYARTCGYAPGEMIGKNHFALYPNEENIAIFTGVRDSGIPVEFHDRPFFFPDQPERGVTYWDWTLAPVKDPFGNIEGLVFSLFETTGRKLAEQALRESENRFQRLFEDDLTGDFICSPEGKILLCNAAFAAIFGFTSSGEAIGKNISSLYPDPEERIHILGEIKRQGKLKEYETLRKRCDGETIHIIENLVGHFNEQGDLYEIQGYLYDNTERKRAVEALHQFNQTLEQKVAERTALAESKAKQLQALAVELIETEERERRRFAHLLHDDLQQMLAAAKMQLQSVIGTLPPDPMLTNVVKLLEESIAKSRRLSHEISPAILHQTDFLANLRWLANQMLEQFGLQVDLELNTELLMDRTPQKVFLFRAVQELLFNTVKHAGVKSAKIEIMSSADSIGVTVSDQGRGIDPDIFEKGNGKVGFGLLTIKERASYIGGKLTVESKAGQGSRFTLTVPNPAVDMDKELEPDESAAKKSEAPECAQKKRVLFADDHHLMRHGIIRLIRGQSRIQVVGEASSGREALEQARKLKPDVIVMDISMPDMDGIEATRRIIEELPGTRVIGLTMHDDEQLTGSMLKAGAEMILNKNTSTAELVKAIFSGIGRN